MSLTPIVCSWYSKLLIAPYRCGWGKILRISSSRSACISRNVEETKTRMTRSDVVGCVVIGVFGKLKLNRKAGDLDRVSTNQTERPS